MPTKNNKCDVEECLHGREQQNLKSGSTGLPADIKLLFGSWGRSREPICHSSWGGIWKERQEAQKNLRSTASSKSKWATNSNSLNGKRCTWGESHSLWSAMPTCLLLKKGKNWTLGLHTHWERECYSPYRRFKGVMANIWIFPCTFCNSGAGIYDMR